MVKPTTNTSTIQSFETFFESWLINQENYLRLLLELCHVNGVGGGEGQENYEVGCKVLIEQVMGHYEEYFGAKSRIVHENVFMVFTPPWFSSFERAYLWIGGFRPCLAIRLVKNNVLDLSDDQSLRINRLTAEIKDEENGLTDELTRVQEGMTSPSIVELVRHLGRLQNGAAHNMESSIESLRASMETLVECADFLRMKMGMKIVEILKPSQAVRFLAAAAQLQLRLRRWGMQRDAQNNQTRRNF